MGKVTIQEYTTKSPITMIGKQAGICYNSNTEDAAKNYTRGLECLQTGHGRTYEFPDVYMILEGYSAKVIRELYTHIGGMPTRLQASTRYINYKDKIDLIIPPTVQNNNEALKIYQETEKLISKQMSKLEKLNIPKEDFSMLLPLGMSTKVICKYNLRNLIDMSHQRLCTRAFWEYKILMKDIMKALSEYSPQWEYIITNYFKPKCEVFGYCTEKNSCNRIAAK